MCLRLSSEDLPAADAKPPVLLLLLFPNKPPPVLLVEPNAPALLEPKPNGELISIYGMAIVRTKTGKQTCRAVVGGVVRAKSTKTT